MRRLITAALIAFAFSSCAVANRPLQGKYQNGPVTSETEISVERIWSRLVDLVARNGLTVSLLDKASGLLVIDRTSLSVTREKSQKDFDRRKEYEPGEIYNRNAWAVSSHWDIAGTVAIPTYVTGKMNVWVKDDGSKRTVNALLYDIRAEREDPKTGAMSYTVKSTGQLENLIVSSLAKP